MRPPRFHSLLVLSLGLFLSLVASACSSSPKRPDIPPMEGEIAYVKKGDIYLRDLETWETTRLTKDGDNRLPSWSPAQAPESAAR